MDIINNKIDELKDNLLKDIIDIVKIPSVKGEPKLGFPFGEEVGNALCKSLEISKKLGFKVNNLDNYIGYAEYGETEDYICVIGHVDVVYEGEGWKYEPYFGTIENSRIYARGVLDNKGPIISALYGLYAIKELGLKLDKKVRIIFGTDEESGFNDIPYYLQREKPPIMGFTPDCKYPVVYGEKGMARLNILLNNKIEQNENEILNNLSNSINITYKKLVKENKELEKSKKILENKNKTKNEELVLDIKLKYDFDYSIEKVIEEIKKNCKDIKKIDIVMHYKPVYFDKNSKLVKSLQEAYEEVTSLDGTPVTTNGGTYAKVMPNIVPFGPSFPGQNKIAHNPDEYMDIKDIILNAKIFAHAIYKLAKEDKC